MTITEKIIAKHAGVEKAEPGEHLMVDIDLALANDITGPVSIEEFKKAGGTKVFDNTKIALIPDHFTPNKDIKAAELCKTLRDFAHKQEILHYYEVGRMGIEHALLPEQGIVLPGDLIIGADSHTCTYGALGAFSTGVGSTDLAYGMLKGKFWLRVPESIQIIYHGKLSPWVTGKDLILYTIGKIGVDGARYKTMEFAGEVIENLSMDERFTICNMAVEAGAKNGIIAPDLKTVDYVRKKAKKAYNLYKSDENAKYFSIIDIDVTSIKPQVAFPHLPENTRDVTDAEGIEIDQAFIGSCTNGRIDDMRAAAKVLKGNKVHPNVRLIVIPATQEVLKQMIEEKIMQIFLEAGAAVGTPTCGPCLGGHMGVLAKGERAISTSNRNFIGRMGHRESEIYLSSPAVAAASAVMGKISHPQEVVK